jgi:hypothetical protein
VQRHLHTRKLRQFLIFSGRESKWHLIRGPFFGHNLYSKYPNGSCKPILNIQVPRAFQWYKKILNLLGFDPCNRPLKTRKSIGIPTPKVGVHLGMWRFNSHPLPYSQLPRSMKCGSRASLFVRTFVSFYFGHEPKARVATSGVVWAIPTWPWLVVSIFKNFVRSFFVWWGY